jgi:3-methyladenine DNA glycosylase/8-oxoguanine DNA glycosylase
VPRRSIPISFPLDLRLTLWRLPHGPGDPTVRVSRTVAIRATRTPDGPVAVRLDHAGGRLTAEAWGPGAERALEALPRLLGFADDPAALRPRHGVVAELVRRLPGLRIGRSDAVLEALVPAVLEQKVPGLQAQRAHAGLIRAFGEPAPGPAGLLVPPEPARLAELPYFAFHRFGIERRRAEAIRWACARAARLEAAGGLEAGPARRILTALPGIGEWTAAEVAATAFGDPDAVSVGDYHLPDIVAWSLAGEPRGDDARMLGLLEPYRGQRGRVIRLLEAGASRPPRFGPRLALRSIARI